MLGGGEVLQPVLYAMAAEKMLGERVNFGRLYYSTIAQNYQAIDVPLNEWSRRRAEQVLANHRCRHARRISSRRAAQGWLQGLRLPAGVRPL